MKLFGTFAYALFIALLVGVTGLFLATLLPIPGNIEVKIVKSGSMEPTIMTGSVVVVKPASSYGVDDIVTFGEDTARQIPTTHRIVAAYDGGAFQTKGDANEEADPQAITQRVIIGKVVFAAPYAGYVLDFARQPIGFTLMIGIPAGIIVLDELAKILSEVRRMRGKKRGEERDEDETPAVFSRADSPRARDLELMTSHTTTRTLDLRHTV